MKEHLQEQIKAVQIKHPKAAEFLAMISRDDSCFAISFDPENASCKACIALAVYDGKEMPMNELCKSFKELPLTNQNPKKEEPVSPEKAPETEAAPAAAKAKKAPVAKAAAPAAKKAPPAAKKAPKKTAPVKEKGPTTKDLIIAQIKAGVNNQADLAVKLDMHFTSVNAALRKLTQKGLIVRKEEGRRFLYTVK